MRFFTQRVSSRLKICSLALPLRCLCVIITTCSVLFLLSYIYILLFLPSFFFCSWLCQIQAVYRKRVSALSKWSGLRQIEVLSSSEGVSGWQGAVVWSSSAVSETLALAGVQAAHRSMYCKAHYSRKRKGFFHSTTSENHILYYSFPFMFYCTNGIARCSIQYYHSL